MSPDQLKLVHDNVAENAVVPPEMTSELAGQIVYTNSQNEVILTSQSTLWKVSTRFAGSLPVGTCVDLVGRASQVGMAKEFEAKRMRSA